MLLFLPLKKDDPTIIQNYIKQKTIDNFMLRERFLKVYANLPLNIRKEIIIVLDKVGPVSWDIAYIEVLNKTKIGETIVKKLEKMEII